MAKTNLTWVDTESFKDLLQAAYDVVTLMEARQSTMSVGVFNTILELKTRVLEFKPQFTIDEKTESVIQ